MIDDTNHLNQAGDTAGPKESRPRIPTRKRHLCILDQLSAERAVTVSALAAELDVSDMTIRRDLIELEREGRLVRVHGGAIAPSAPPPVTMDKDEPSFDSRLQQRREAKLAIAGAAAEIVAKYRTIALDVGTTTFLLATLLRKLEHTKIFTNSMRIAAELDGTAADVYIAGGRLRDGEQSVCGPSAVAQFEALWFDVSVIGVSGVTSEGLFDYSFEEVDMKRVYLRRAALKIALCDSAKFQRMSLMKIAPLEDLDILITDAAPPKALAAALDAANVDVRIARPGLPS
ncbi:DeoR/GlpR family DNA-binding transcription regulator [Pelagibius sp. CAU 1746]|uniref:DeoR/GlpR family DNA-binding transcription regulator n=1 Tax=Pelagibius sp. CAU 1746 TaxID=3140370 RepID=UPI00325AEAB0